MAGIDAADGSDETPGSARAAAEADRARLWTAIEAHRERLLRLSRRRTATAQDAEDCVQEALLRAMEFPDLDESRLGSFLTTVTVRLCADRHRERAGEARLLQRIGLGVTEVPGPEDDVCERGEAAWLAATFDQLPRRQQQVVRAREAGLSCAEVASHLRMSYVSVESSLARARSRFRATLARATSLVPVSAWRWAARADVVAVGTAGALTVGALFVAPAAGPPVPRPDTAAPRGTVALVVSPPPARPTPRPVPAPVAAAPVPRRLVRQGIPSLVPAPRPSPTPTEIASVPGGAAGARTDPRNGDFTQEERLLHCVQYGVELGELPVKCHYPPEERP